MLQTFPASEQETRLVVSAFKEFRKGLLEECGCCLDAEVDAEVSIAGWFSDYSGKLTGYLQAMEPGFIKFVALNPLGQPLLIFLSDGEIFKSLNVLEFKAYTGSVHSETFNKYAPQGFEPEFSYYWLTGRLPPGDLAIQQVRRDRVLDIYWLHVRFVRSGLEGMILFDPQKFVILRHIILDGKGKQLVDLVYDDYEPENVREEKLREGDREKSGSRAVDKTCMLPTKVTAISDSGAERKIGLKLFSLIPDVEFSPEDFNMAIPANLEQLIVK